MGGTQLLKLPYSLSLSTAFARLNYLVAGLSLLTILCATILLWPVEYLGFEADIATDEVVQISPESVAEKAGLLVGDRILTLYNRPRREVLTSVNVVELIGSDPVPISVERHGKIITTELDRSRPSLAFQLSKLSLLLLALLCWGTGYHLGVVRRHSIPGSPLVATFWLCIGGIIGALLFSQYVAFPIHAALVWLVVVLMAPLAIYIHLWFPFRLINEIPIAGRLGVYLFGSAVVLNAALVIWLGHQGWSIVALHDALVRLAPFAVVTALAASGYLLRRAYRITTVAHIRRQIRLIMLACLAVMLIWVLAVVIPMLAQSQYLVHGRWLTLVVGCVPLAYVIGGRTPDLYRLDRLATRAVVHLGTAAGLGLALAGGSIMLVTTRKNAAFVIAVAFVALYRPIQNLILRLLPRSFGAQDQKPIDDAIQGLHTTLDASTLLKTLTEGVRTQFGQPAIAVYLPDCPESNTLTLEHREHLTDLPQTLTAGPLMRALRGVPSVAETKSLQQQVIALSLSQDEKHLLAHPAVALWCPIRHAQGHLLGLLLLGMRADLDPYREVDQQGLRRLIAAASLAFAHSSAYSQQVEDQARIRELYQALQEAQDTAAAELARVLHDQIINGYVQFNVSALRRIVRQCGDNGMRDQLRPILKREQQLIYQLRRISEELHPFGIDDPLGLPMVLELEVNRQGQLWEGQCKLEVLGPIAPLTARAQQEAFRITREAISNAIKHATATEIVVRLCYPSLPNELVELSIQDNGRNAYDVADRPGHRGKRYMEESARTVGGTLSVEIRRAQSTTVTFRFPLGPPSLEPLEEIEPHDVARNPGFPVIA